ncbi:MAG TPA: tripartite tricarboxylate transporter substrate binding protein [Burkholderiales bacterium]|jgi:tripartite-type tricarboxylate transporter receptor subunit TctC|nr:tripartite tricarboxylate transporter substrate binding protein [Burkholderiales bacterium]
MTLQTRIIALAGALLATAAAPALAQDKYPNKPIRLIVAFPPGGSTDIIARLVAQRLAERLGQQVIIDNRGGAGGTLGTEIAARANPDGYTLTMGTTSTHVIAPAAYAKLKYDPIKDFAPITLVASTPYLLVLNPGVKASSLKEFVALAKSEPGKLNYASAGTGSTTHLAMEMLKSAAGLDIVHVPYNGNGPAGAAVLGGQVQALFGSMPAVLPQAKSGKLRPIAVGTAKRSSALPDVPTVAESGYPGFEVSLWLGFFAPRGTPIEIINRLHGELARIALSPEMKEQFERNGAEPATNVSSLDLQRLVRSEIDKYSKVIKAANIKLE